MPHLDRYRYGRAEEVKEDTVEADWEHCSPYVIWWTRPRCPSTTIPTLEVSIR